MSIDTLKVLVVDDELGIRLGVTRVLQNHRIHLPDSEGEMGFELTQAETGEEALELLEHSSFDILLLDHKLPGISGLDVLEKVRQTPRDMLVIMITAYATIETAVSATKRGAHDFLAKPFTPDELKATIYKAAKHLFLQWQARRLQQEKRQVRFQFISVLGHELKTPLAAVEGYINVFKDRAVPLGSPEFDELLDRSQARIEGMRKMIADLLDLTSIESGQKQRELQDVDLVEIAKKSIEAVSPAAAARQIMVELHALSPLVLQADAGELEIVMNNLVSNAVKYNREAGRVDVTLEDAGDKLRITVQDTGIGMSKDEAATLFKEFVRIKNAKTRGILGSGLGLSIVKKLALLYGGDASVTSEPDQGSTFVVTLAKTPPPSA